MKNNPGERDTVQSTLLDTLSVMYWPRTAAVGAFSSTESMGVTGTVSDSPKHPESGAMANIVTRNRAASERFTFSSPLTRFQDRLTAHVGLQDLRHSDAPVLKLVLFHDGDQRP